MFVDTNGQLVGFCFVLSHNNNQLMCYLAMGNKLSVSVYAIP